MLFSSIKHGIFKSIKSRVSDGRACTVSVPHDRDARKRRYGNGVEGCRITQCPVSKSDDVRLRRRAAVGCGPCSRGSKEFWKM